ncbi:DUF6483 family protein [Paenibacillus sp. DMB20]|uniref:DUF6483 family protein n=1 Tax=Paenibacillus sp. DMB20 TaxID=1642570 RepID=UPI000627F112|nr:DUF6483 family protein [Paenibacillus sp. DMB20]KKO53026.1 hypothetical protein XI25_14995 [Paenibacillus sp. DMB20]
MFRKDYLLRLVEEMTQLIAKVYGLKQQRKVTEALWEIDELLTRQFGLNSKLLRSLSAPDIVRLFRTAGVLEADKLQNAARLMEEEARIHLDSERRDEGLILMAKALHLYLTASLNDANPNLWDLPRRIDDTAGDLRSFRLPEETERLLLVYFERAGRYAEAENSLFRLLEQDVLDLREGSLFYERLLNVPPDELERGGLPLAEVHEGIAELERRFADTPGQADIR